jgi:hypothetical protein
MQVLRLIVPPRLSTDVIIVSNSLLISLIRQADTDRRHKYRVLQK